MIDVAAGNVVRFEEDAHEGAIWSIDVKRPTADDPSIHVLTGSADKSVKFWSIEADEDENDKNPCFVHTRTLQMTDDVIAAKYSKTPEYSKRLVFVSTLDSTIKVFFDDSLKLFLSLYGHKLPALAVDCTDDDMLLASSGADKTVKIWGLDFGDTHKTLLGHEDSVTDLRFVRGTHNFFSCSKDGSIRYWDGDRFEQILLIEGHFAEVSSLAIARTGAFVLSAGMDRQVRVLERTTDIVFLQEERERELDRIFDKDSGREEGKTTEILDRNRATEENENSGDPDESRGDAAVKRSILSVAGGDRIMEALELADEELQAIRALGKQQGMGKRAANPLLLGKEPADYVLWVLQTVKTSELEQSLVMLSTRHVERLLYYIVVLLRKGAGVELCSRVAIFLARTFQHQVRCAMSNRFQSLANFLAFTACWKSSDGADCSRAKAPASFQAISYLGRGRIRFGGAENDIKDRS
jgi:U3 small nucleolar RNA-associated protein 12